MSFACVDVRLRSYLASGNSFIPTFALQTLIPRFSTAQQPLPSLFPLDLLSSLPLLRAFSSTPLSAALPTKFNPSHWPTLYQELMSRFAALISSCLYLYLVPIHIPYPVPCRMSTAVYSSPPRIVWPVGLGELCSKNSLLCYAPMLLNTFIMLPRILYYAWYRHYYAYNIIHKEICTWPVAPATTC